jgi:hypothetical protein
VSGPAALSKALAHGARMSASNVPDRVLAAVQEERAVRRLKRRVGRWQRMRRVW